MFGNVVATWSIYNNRSSAYKDILRSVSFTTICFTSSESHISCASGSSKITNSNADMGQPCRVPHYIGNLCDHWLPVKTTTLGLLYKILSIFMTFSPKPILCIVYNKGHSSLSNVSTDNIAHGDEMSVAACITCNSLLILSDVSRCLIKLFGPNEQIKEQPSQDGEINKF